MQRLRSITVSIFLSLAAAAHTLGQDEGPDTGRYDLANGIRVVAVHVPGATRQCTFTFLPPALANDPVHRAQWSHLLEHMVIRSTDAEGLVAAGVEFNGETQPHSLRLDTYAAPDSFRESFEKHARWLSADAFDGAALAREKQMIAQEEHTVVQGNFAHKFAVAAWNQIVRHGLDHAAVHADIANAAIADVSTFAADAMSVDDSVLVATIGPADPAQVRTALEQTIGRVPARARDAEIDRATSDPIRGGALNATWDLDASHLLLWWRLPDDSTATRALALTIEMSIMQAGRALQGGVVLATSLFNLPEGPVLLINASLTDEQNPDEVRERLTAIVNSIAANTGQLMFTNAMLAREMGAPPNFEMMRAQTPEQYRWLVEGQWVLTIGQYEFTWSRTLEGIVADLQAIDQPAIEAAAAPLTHPPAGSLHLTPRD